MNRTKHILVVFAFCSVIAAPFASAQCANCGAEHNRAEREQITRENQQTERARQEANRENERATAEKAEKASDAAMDGKLGKAMQEYRDALEHSGTPDK